MILADKIIKHRKLNGWSQEELAERMNVSRQAVSKWESAQSVPELDKILKLSSTFNVTTDYLLKDEIETETETETFINDSEISSVRKVTMQEAVSYLAIRKKASLRIAIATFMCIISPICMFILGVLSESPYNNISENTAALVGLIVLFIIVAAAVGIFIFTGFESATFSFMENEPFETEYGVSEMVENKKKSYYNTYVKMNIIGTILCVLSPIALFITAVKDNDFFAVCMLSVMMIIAGIGVILLIIAGVRHASMQRLLKDPDYVNFKFRKRNPFTQAIRTIYWLIATAIYLGWSFSANSWHDTWIVWPIAGVLFGAVSIICSLFEKKNSSQ
ncbi:MAG: helix-turn-helix domain-containing protein [Ruminococcus sp.]|nr:helix-turn-helix domain-containing protein [Ruminococcus sp.]